MEYIGKKNINLIAIISVMIAFLLTGTYAYLNLTSTNSSATGQAGCFEVNYSAQEINTSELVSTNDYTKGAKSQVTLSKNTGCQIYTEASIYIHTNTTTTTAPINEVKALKYKVLSGNTSISEGVITTTNGADLKIATVTLSTTATTYTVYIWVDSDISIGFYNGTAYSGYIYAESTQSSTVK